jgi:hypothetical protein
MSAHVDGDGAPKRTGPDWLPPAPLGFLGGASSAVSVAAPLLAGFALTLVGLVLQVQDDLKWPDAALALLVAAALMLLGAVQFGVWASGYAVTPDQIAQWLPHFGPRALANAQRGHLYEYSRWYRRFAVAYHLGILLLLAGLAVALVPDKDTDEWRYVAIGIALLGGVAELIWIWAVRRRPKQVFTPPGPGSKAPDQWPAEPEAPDWGYVHARLDAVSARLDELQKQIRQLTSARSD